MQKQEQANRNKKKGNRQEFEEEPNSNLGCVGLFVVICVIVLFLSYCLPMG